MSNEKPLPNEVGSFKELIKIEDEHLVERRQKIYGSAETLEELEETKFGIALSGGGIRSATINLGFLKTLNKFGILKRADYLSTVSGGGYTGAYVQATLKAKGDYDGLFQKEHIEYMRSRGEYLMPGQGLLKRWNVLILIVGYTASLIMSWLSPAIVVALLYIGYTLIEKISKLEQGLGVVRGMLEGSSILVFSLYVLGAIFAAHLVANLFLRYNVGVSRRFNQVESGIVAIGLLWLITFWITGLDFSEKIGIFAYWEYVVAAAILIVAGFFTNPNAISFHRFYRNQLADAFLHFTGDFSNVSLKELFKPKSKNPNDYLAPYPLINTCLNLQSIADDRFQGAKASDYFLLSPLYCGAKLTGYVATENAPDYKQMTLPAATTISAAAVNPGMGTYSSKMLSIVMTLLNARLGFWVANPLKLKKGNAVWWPIYFFYELFSLIGTNNRKLNISDGGHIENLGVYELLRRNCRLIIAVDAGADPTFSFTDLETLNVRSRNELGLDISFRPGESPEEVVRPKPSSGYSKKRFAIADVYRVWEEIKLEDERSEAILGTDGKKIELLVNYKRVRTALSELNAKEHEEMKVIIEKLNLTENVREVLATLGMENKVGIQEIVRNLTANARLQNAFVILLSMLEDVNKLLKKRLGEQLSFDARITHVFRKVIGILEKRMVERLKMGTLIYVKSSVTAPEGKPQLDRKELLYQTYKYKIYHPSFPHESTSDQFFDAVQWESYFQLGQYIGAEVLGDDKLEAFRDSPKTPFSIRTLLAHFDQQESLFARPAPVIVPTPPSEPAAPVKSKEIEREPAIELTPDAPIMEEVAMGASEPESIPAPTPEPAPEVEEEKVVLGEEVQYKM